MFERMRPISRTAQLGEVAFEAPEHLPVIGNLFRYTQNSNEKVELLVFITPKIIEDGLAIR